ncbi:MULTISPECIES: serine protease [Kordiimonas]|uniref:Putative serine protein kinase, PrkA n=1 Tax=Kordiimonas lacus TaxID=637679 RepID=A0A1G6YG89_9PROT|nr:MULTISPECIES: serine protease [Kordiimonas]SDD89003.1 putative serine protein kinase, PrkA [Kordiimonas lacus]
MVKKDKSFAELISTDREKRAEEEWSGTFLDYLELLRENPHLPMLAHKRVYEALIDKNDTVLTAEDDPRIGRLFGDEGVKVYTKFKDIFFGIEPVVDRIVRYFHAAALKGEESRQVLYLMGPVGAGKSSLVDHVHHLFETAAPMMAIEGCPIQEEPLHLTPRHLREEFEKMLGVHVEGDLCPVCRYRLKEEFGGEYEKMRVISVRPSKRARRAIAVVPPVDPNNQDTSVLIGSEDISKLDKYSESDPRVLNLDGAFDAGNRGIVEFIEVFKNETEYLHTMITATQEKQVPAPGRHGMVYVDCAILAHSNEAEWRKFKAEHTNEAILDRIVVVKVPYNLRLSEEVKIYQKILGKSGFDGHIAPHTLETAAMFAILSRLEPSNKCDRMTKLRLYNGDEVIEKGRTKKVDIEELKGDAQDEGLSGISTRFIVKALDIALSKSPDGITPIHIREALIDMVKESEFADDKKKDLLGFLQDTIHKEYLSILEKEITKAFVHAYEEQAETLFHNYLDHAEAYVNKSKVKDRDTKEELEPDENFLKSIEEQIAIVGSACQGFRQEVIAFLWSATRRKEKITYTSYAPLKDAIEKRLTSSVRDISRIVTASRTRDEDQRNKYDKLVEDLLDLGYTPYSADVILKYAANNLWKD